MRKSVKKIASLFFVLLMSITLAGCSLTSKKDKSTIEVDNYVEKYYVNQYFLVSGTKLVVKNSKNKILEEIVVTKEMIKEMPDMTTTGEKEIVIVYEGKEYSYKIVVEDRPVDELVNKLSDFLAQYENKNDYKMETSYEINLDANYFGDTINVNDSQVMILFGQLFAGDDLTNEAYHALFNSIINGSFDLENDDVIDSNNFQTRLDLIRILEKVKNELSDFDYKTYVFEKAFGADDLKNIENVVEQISNMFVINSPVGKSSIRTIVSKYYYKLKAFEYFDVVDAVKELLNKVETYSDSPAIKQMLDVVDTIKNEDLIHFTSSVMEDYWTNYARVMTLGEYRKDYWDYDYDPSFVNNVNSRLLLNKFIAAQKNIVYAIEETLVDLTSVRSVEDYKNEVVDVLLALENYVSALSETTKIQKNNSWLIVLDEGYYFEPILGGHYEYNYDEDMIIFEPNYDDSISNYDDLKVEFSNLRNYIEEYTIIEIIKDQQLVENLIKIYFEDYSQNDRQTLIDSIYGLLENDLSLKEAYVDVIDVLLTEENGFYTDYLSDIVSEFFFVEDATGKQKIKQLVEDLFSDVVNAQGFDVAQLYKDLLDCVNTYTTNQQVENLTGSLEELSYDELIHLPSTLFGKHFESFMKVMTPEEHAKDYFNYGYNPTYVTSQSAQTLLNNTIKAHKDAIYGMEESIEAFADVRNVTQLKNESKNLLNKLITYTARMKEIVEIQKDNNWVIVLEDGHDYSEAMIGGSYYSYCGNDDCEDGFEPDYDGDIAIYNRYNEILEQIHNYIGQYTIVEIIEENEGIEKLVKKYMEDYTDAEQEKIIDLIYDVLNREATKEEIRETIEEVFITNKNIVIEQLIEYFEVYVNEGIIPLFDLLVSQYESEITDALVSLVGDLISNEALLEEVELLIEDVVSGYVNGNLNSEDIVNCIKDIFNTYTSEDAKVTFGLATIMYHVFNYDENIDYNELFGDYVELPNQIDNVDYNELMKKLVNESTYDAFKLSDVEVKYIVDEQDNIVGELLTVKMDVDFDVLMISLKGSIGFNIEIDFTNEGN